MIILSVVVPPHNGVIAYDNGGALASFGPASNNPARANAGNSHSAMRQADSQLRFSFETASGTAGTGSGSNDQVNAFSAIAIAIQGTAGESGAVTLNLSAGGDNLPGPSYVTLPSSSSTKTRTSYPATQNNIITGLSVGDEFAFMGGLTARDNRPIMQGTLSVGPV